MELRLRKRFVMLGNMRRLTSFAVRYKGACQKIALTSLCLVGVMPAESQQDAIRKAMETSVARQKASVALMRLSIEKQRATANAAAPETGAGGLATPTPTSFFTLSWPALGSACDPMPDAELGPLIQQAAQKEGLEEGLLRAVTEQESGRRPCALSSQGAMGLMQLMPATAQELGVRDPFDPQENLFSGAHFLKQLLTRFGGDTALALAAYNAGPARVEETGGMPQIPETVRYVRQILSRLPIP